MGMALGRHADRGFRGGLAQDKGTLELPDCQ